MAGISDSRLIREQARRYLEARYNGADVWFRAPETFGNMLERWIWAVASRAEETLGEECMRSIEEHLARVKEEER